MNKSAQSETKSEYEEEQLENILAKRDLISKDVVDEVLGLQYIYANQTRYYNQCLSSYTPNPPEPDSNASEKCKNTIIMDGTPKTLAQTQIQIQIHQALQLTKPKKCLVN